MPHPDTGGDQPCCQGRCTQPNETKYWSLATALGPFGGKKHCGESCLNPKDYKLYHLFEKNLTESDSDTPCHDFGYTLYDSTPTHGFGPIKVTVDLYNRPKLE